MYQALGQLFKEYEGTDHQRGDCKERADKILSAAGQVTGEVIVDFGCAEGYFGFRMLYEGAKHVIFVDREEGMRDTVKKIGEKHFEPFRYTVLPDLKGIENVDIILYLDLIYNDGTLPSILDMSNLCSELFVSPSGNNRNERLMNDILKVYESAELLHIGFENRAIFGCKHLLK